MYSGFYSGIFRRCEVVYCVHLVLPLRSSASRLREKCCAMLKSLGLFQFVRRVRMDQRYRFTNNTLEGFGEMSVFYFLGQNEKLGLECV